MEKTVKFNSEDYTFVDTTTGEVLNYIRVCPKECKTKDGKKFYAYRAVDKSGKFVDLVFTKASGFTEVSTNFILVGVDYNVDHNRLFPRIYVKSYKAIEEFRPIKDLIDF